MRTRKSLWIGSDDVLIVCCPSAFLWLFYWCVFFCNFKD